RGEGDQPERRRDHEDHASHQCGSLGVGRGGGGNDDGGGGGGGRRDATRPSSGPCASSRPCPSSARSAPSGASVSPAAGTAPKSSARCGIDAAAATSVEDVRKGAPILGRPGPDAAPVAAGGGGAISASS